MFLVNPVNVSSDSLFLTKGDAVAYPANNELDELFFKYGVRLNKDIVTDLYSAPIVLAQGEYNESEYRPYPWVYHPLVEPQNDHPIGSALGNVLQRFVSSIDTLKNPLKKTVLLATSNDQKNVQSPFSSHWKKQQNP